jgi:cation diffusion facilitator family transporter
MNQKTGSPSRFKKGKIAGFVGIFANLILAFSKMIAGEVFGAVSLVADGVNNLSDAAASVVMLLGFSVSEKPADKEHPYGHARFEYLSSLVVSILILMVGFEFFKTSVKKIIDPAAIDLSPLLFVVLVVSILVKGALWVYFGFRAKKLSSKVLFAASADSRNDAGMTLLILLCALIEKFFGLQIDGVAGAFLAVFIFWSGLSIAGKTVSTLLGGSADPALKKKIISKIESEKGVIGCHDLMMHDYGPGKTYASVHVEMDKNTDPMLCHHRIDQIERECKEDFGVHLVIHYDPVELDNPETERLKILVQALLSARSPRLLIHDFRLLIEEEKRTLYFDLAFPNALLEEKSEIEENLKSALSKIEGMEYGLEITLDPEA